MEFEKTKLIELKEKFDSIINTEEKENMNFGMLESLKPAEDLKKLEEE